MPSELALNMRSSWNHASDDIWRQLEPVQWRSTHNPWGVQPVSESESRERGGKLSVDPALRQRVDKLFTLDTAVAASLNRFAPALTEPCLGGYAEHEPGLSRFDLLAQGRCHPGDASEPFDMVHPALRSSGAVNGVSARPGELSAAAAPVIAAPASADYTSRALPFHEGVAVPLEAGHFHWLR